jgi:hypothetical protein
VRVLGVGLMAIGALLFAGALWLWAGAPEHDPLPARPDTDGEIPVTSVCRPDEPQLASTFHDRRVRDGKVVEIMARIEINDCRLRELRAGPEDRQRVIAHEKAHARGWKHFEGTPWTNDAFWPRYRITGE